MHQAPTGAEPMVVDDDDDDDDDDHRGNCTKPSFDKAIQYNSNLCGTLSDTFHRFEDHSGTRCSCLDS